MTPGARSQSDVGLQTASTPVFPSAKTINLSRKNPKSRSNSVRSKGIGLNLAVSPASISPNPNNNPAVFGSTSSPGTVSHLSQVPEDPVSRSDSTSPSVHGGPISELKYDIPLPSMAEVSDLDIEGQLRLLALREMSIVEIKDSIASLNSKLQHHENELRKLREVIQKSLYMELSNSQNHEGRRRNDSNSTQEALANSKSHRGKLSLSQDKPDYSKDKGGLWSSLSKPLSLIQQLDTMLQNEFEKSLTSPPPNQQTHPVRRHKTRLSEDSTSSVSSVPSPLQSRSGRNDPVNLDGYIEGDETKPKGPEDMMQVVSSSLWSFVSEIRNNVLNSMNDEDETSPYIDNGSNMNSNDSNDHTIINENEFDKLLDLN
ncbi:topoisomerase I damage affected protein 1 [Yamadazyma tenuis]|nr:topoisomerase I damage affected protein 1 [Yamadazyma tenuis]